LKNLVLKVFGILASFWSWGFFQGNISSFTGPWGLLINLDIQGVISLPQGFWERVSLGPIASKGVYTCDF